MPDQPMRVIVFKREGRPFFQAEWTDRESGRKRRRSTGHEKRRDAERWAAKLEAELNAGVEQGQRRMTWEAFRERVKRDLYPERRKATRVAYESALRAVDEFLNPLLVSAIDAEAIDKLKSQLRTKGAKGKPVRETTIASYLRALKAILRWGHSRKLIATVPRIEMPKDTKVAGGRPITDDEFAKVLEMTPSVIGDERAASWTYLLRGLWTSGLRVSEAALLTWDDPSLPRVDLDRERPMLIIRGEHQKSGRDTITPIVPEFLDLLLETSVEDRKGFVFNPQQRKLKTRPQLDAMKSIITEIGKASGIRTHHSRETYVSAHDLRRSFCHRWSRRVLPQVLRVLARHQDVATTLTYYADADADMTFDAVYEAVGARTTAKIADHAVLAPESPASKTTQAPIKSGLA